MKRVRTFHTCLLLTVMLCCGAAITHAADLLKVTGSLWSPYLDDQLPNGGLAADLVRTALTRAGYDIQPNVETWTRAYEGTVVGVYDVVAAIWQNEAREEKVLFSKPYLLNEIVLVTRAGVHVEYNQLSDLAGYRIGVVRDYAYDDAFDTHPGLTRVVNGHLVQNLLLLRDGKVDMVVGDKWAILQQISEFLPNDVAKFRLLDKPVASTPLRLGVSRTNPNAQQIADRFDAAIAAMKEDGSFAEIVKRHTSSFTQPPGGS